MGKMCSNIERCVFRASLNGAHFFILSKIRKRHGYHATMPFRYAKLVSPKSNQSRRRGAVAPLPSRFWCLPPSRWIFSKSIGQTGSKGAPLARFGDFGEYQSHISRHINILLSLNLNPTKRTTNGRPYKIKSKSHPFSTIP